MLLIDVMAESATIISWPIKVKIRGVPGHNQLLRWIGLPIVGSVELLLGEYNSWRISLKLRLWALILYQWVSLTVLGRGRAQKDFISVMSLHLVCFQWVHHVLGTCYNKGALLNWFLTMKRYHCCWFLMKLKLRWGLLTDPLQVLVQFHQFTWSLAHVGRDNNISAIDLIRSRPSLLDYDLLHIGKLIYGQLDSLGSISTSSAALEGIFGAPAWWGNLIWREMVYLHNDWHTLEVFRWHRLLIISPGLEGKIHEVLILDVSLWTSLRFVILHLLQVPRVEMHLQLVGLSSWWLNLVKGVGW